MLDQVDDRSNVSFCVLPFVLAHTVGIFFPGLYLALYYHTIVLGSLVINESITQKPFLCCCLQKVPQGCEQPVICILYLPFASWCQFGG